MSVGTAQDIAADLDEPGRGFPHLEAQWQQRDNRHADEDERIVDDVVSEDRETVHPQGFA